jgi:serine/threonine protein phosphatase PrpC
MLKNSRVYLESGWSINVSRSLGDAKYKVDDVLTCRPDIYRFDVSPDHLIIIASDGLVNNLRIPDTEIGTRYIQHNHRVRELVKQAVKCIAGDNVTVICISL